MEDAAVSLADKENNMAVQEATQHYEDRMKEVGLPTETLNDFMTLSSQYEDEARQIFLKKSFNDKDQQFLQKYMENIHKKKGEFSVLNETKSREVCEELIKKHSADFEKAMKEGVYHKKGGHAKFKEDLKAIEEKYNVESGKRVKAEEVLQDFIKSQQNFEIIIIQEDNALSIQQKKEEEENARKKIAGMEKELHKLQEAQREQKVEEERNNVQKTFSQLVEKMEEGRRKVKENFDEVIRQKEREQQLFMDQGLQRQANMYREQIKDIQKEKKEHNSPAWYESIVEAFKSVAAAVLPGIITTGGIILKKTFDDKFCNVKGGDK